MNLLKPLFWALGAMLLGGVPAWYLTRSPSRSSQAPSGARVAREASSNVLADPAATPALDRLLALSLSETTAVPPEEDLGARIQEVVKEGSGRASVALETLYDLPGIHRLVRVEILAALGSLGQPDGVRILASLARREEALSSQARFHLSLMRSRQAAPALAELIEEEALRGELAAAAIRALGASGLRQYVASLSAWCESGDAAVGLAAVGALGDVADPDGIPALKSALDRPIPRLRRAAIRALGKIRDPRSIQALEAHLASDPGDFESELVRDQLAAFGGTSRSPFR